MLSKMTRSKPKKIKVCYYCEGLRPIGGWAKPPSFGSLGLSKVSNSSPGAHRWTPHTSWGVFKKVGRFPYIKTLDSLRYAPPSGNP